MLRINIDGNSFDGAVDGLPELEERIFRSDELKGFLTEITGGIKLYGKAYQYVRNKYRSDLYCRFTVQIDEFSGTSWMNIFTGEIKAENIVFDLIKKEATAELTDMGFFALMEANRKVKANTGIGVSVSGVSIPTPPLYDFDFCDVTNYLARNSNYLGGSGGTITLPMAKGRYIGDVLAFLISFMTDGRVGFVSDFLDYSNPANLHAFNALFSGREIRLPGQPHAPVISWDELFSDLHRLHNLWFTIEYGGARPVVRVEPYEYFIRSGQNMTADIVEITEAIDKTQLYNVIRVGCSRTDRGFIPERPSIYHTQEEYITGIPAKEDNVLDLQLKTLIINTNSIKRVLPTRLRGGHEIKEFAAMRGQNIGSPAAYQLADRDGRAFAANDVTPGMLAVNYTAAAEGIPAVVEAIGANPDELVMELNVFFGSHFYVIYNQDDELDDNIFYVQFTSANLCRVRITKEPPISAGYPNKVIYNPDIINNLVIKAHEALIPVPVIYIQQPNNEMLIGIKEIPGGLGYIGPDGGPLTNPPPIAPNIGASSQTWYWEWLVFNDDTAPPCVNLTPPAGYDTTTGIFRPIVGAYGNYDFRLKAFFQLDTGNVGFFAIQQYDSTMTTLIDERIIDVSAYPVFNWGIPIYEVDALATFNLQAGDVVIIVAGSTTTDWRIFEKVDLLGTGNRPTWMSFFRLLATPDQAAIINIPSNPELTPISYTVSGNIAPDVWRNIRANPYVALALNYGSGKYQTARIKEITRSLLGGEMSGDMRGGHNTGFNPFNE